ncbi:pirin-like C-terminal cupin domain-containing protein [Pseudomonas putida]|uniref:pirin-like C-terminal cupin domain-containing protein n=1 Tax=Pseudomonas putida TaxID=303 RepID=UPI003C6E61A6
MCRGSTCPSREKCHPPRYQPPLSEKAINEPLVGYRPFVMNSGAEIPQALQDLRVGRFGQRDD